MPNRGQVADNVISNIFQTEEIADIFGNEDISRCFSVEAETHQCPQYIAMRKLIGKLLYCRFYADTLDGGCVGISNIFFTPTDCDPSLGIFITTGQIDLNAVMHGEQYILLCHTEEVGFSPDILFFGSLCKFGKSVLYLTDVFHGTTYIRIPLQ